MSIQLYHVRRSNRFKGFSFLEVLAVVALVSIIVAITITRLAETSDAAKEKSCRHNRAQLNSALERFAVSTGSFATSISDINTDQYFPGGVPVCPVDDSAYTLNSTTHRIDGHTH